MKLADLKRLMALDGVLASSGLLIPEFAREHRLTQSSVSKTLDLILRLGRIVELRPVDGQDRLFYHRSMLPVFRDTPIHERRGMTRRIDRNEVRRMRAEGFSRIETAKKAGCTPDMVRKIEVGAGSTSMGRKA